MKKRVNLLKLESIVLAALLSGTASVAAGLAGEIPPPTTLTKISLNSAWTKAKKFFDVTPDGDDDDDQSPTTPPKIEGPFIVRPYVFSEKGEKIAVGWSYKDKKSVTDPIELKFSIHGATVNLVPVIDDDLFVVELPMNTCDFGSDVAYQVTGMAQPQSIANIPCPGHPGQTTRFVFLADTQEGVDFAKQFATLAAQYNSAAVLLGGDFVQEGYKQVEWLSFFDAMDPVLKGHVLFPVVGNHEYKYDPKVPFWKHYLRSNVADAYYSTDIGDARVIVLNSCFYDDTTLRLKEASWLVGELQKPARWRIIVFHHPAFAKGITNAKNYPKKEYLVLQQDYIPLFEKYGVDLVLNGHTHIFEHSVKDGIQYITTGPAGGRMGIYGAKNPYSVKADRIRTMVQLEVSDQALRAVTTTIDGKTIDEVELTKK